MTTPTSHLGIPPPARDNPRMLYQITCTCGHTFQKSDEDLKKPVACPSCGKPLSVVIPTAEPAAGSAAPASPIATAETEPTKRCPYCGEVILAVARKCKHCGEFLDRSPIAGGTPPATAVAPTPGSPAVDDAVFSLTVSQWNNFWRYLIIFTAVLVITIIFIGVDQLHPLAPVVILGSLVLGGFVAWFFFLYSRNTKIFIRPLRIDIERGILSRKIDTLELFRINDTELKQGMIERIVGIGTISLITDDKMAEPEMVLYEIPRAREVHKYLQTQIPLAARQRGAVYLER